MKVLGLSAGRCRAVRRGSRRRRHREQDDQQGNQRRLVSSSRTSRRRSTSKADVPGEHAFRVKATKGANPWDVQASSPVAGRHQ